MNVKVNIINQDIKMPKELVDAADGDELIARLFFNRGYKDAGTIRQMLHEEFYEPTKTEEFPHIKEAVDRIMKAVDAKELIAVYGDYDVDGVTSTALLVQSLNFFTPSVIYHVPDRFTEGYGMNEEIVRSFPEKGVSLIITCDCGISNVNEINLAKELGMDVIITDHHNIPDIMPAADVILNPKLLPEGHRARNISGCGMAYFLSQALFEHSSQPKEAEKFLDLLALSLVADVVSLNGENRYLLKKAIPKLFEAKRVGLKELFNIIEQTSKLQSEEDIAFQIAPRINAAGRMESARLPIELFLSNNASEAKDMAFKIDCFNKDRKGIQQEMVEQAIKLVEDRKKNKTILVLFNEFWHHGIIGIAAGKICDTYKKPVILLTLKEDGKTVVGSARSIEEINIYELLKACSGKLLKFGGHSQAAGLSLKKEEIEAFTLEIERLAENRHFIRDEIQINVDMELGFEKVDEGLYSRLCSAGPFGEGFESPMFAARKVSVVSDRKTEKNHHIMVLAGENNTRVPAVKWFGINENLQDKVVDITYKIGKNTYKGNSNLQLTIDYMIDVEGDYKKAFEGDFTDERGARAEKILQNFDDAVAFYEGLNLQKLHIKTFDRYSIRPANTLIFLSTPVNTLLFREIVALVNPKEVVINFSAIPDYAFKGFVINFLGLLKYIMLNEGGRTNIELLSFRLCVEESIIKAAFKYLKAIGKIKYSIEEDGSVLFDRKDEKPLSNVIITEKNLKDALAEKNAYQQFILKLEIERFKEYLK